MKTIRIDNMDLAEALQATSDSLDAEMEAVRKRNIVRMLRDGKSADEIVQFDAFSVEWNVDAKRETMVEIRSFLVEKFFPELVMQ